MPVTPWVTLVRLTAVPSRLISGLVVVLVNAAPPKMPISWVAFTVDPVADRNGPASETRAALAGDPNGLAAEDKVSRRPTAGPPVISVPPAVTVLLVRSISAPLDELSKLERFTVRSENSGRIVLCDAESSGPDRLTVDGATSSPVGKPVTVSVTRKKLAPDCASEIVTVELDREMRADDELLDSVAPCSTENVEQQLLTVPNVLLNPRLVVLIVTSVPEKSGPAREIRLGWLVDGDRRTLRKGPWVSMVALLIAINGEVEVLVIAEPSSTVMNARRLFDRPLVNVPPVAENKGPARLIDDPLTSRRKLPSGSPFVAVNDRRAPVPEDVIELASRKNSAGPSAVREARPLPTWLALTSGPARVIDELVMLRAIVASTLVPVS